jgi:multiple sugar transport system substrate-binding protein
MTLWKKAGMSDKAAKSYLGAIQDSLNSPNMVLDLRIPQNQKYEQVILDTAVARFLAGELTAEDTMKSIEDGWNETTDEIGRDEQLAAYKSTLGAQ